MKRIIKPILLLALLPMLVNSDDNRIQSLANRHFATGARVGYMLGKIGGSKQDLETVVGSFESNRVDVALAVYRKLGIDIKLEEVMPQTTTTNMSTK